MKLVILKQKQTFDWLSKQASYQFCSKQFHQSLITIYALLQQYYIILHHRHVWEQAYTQQVLSIQFFSLFFFFFFSFHCVSSPFFSVNGVPLIYIHIRYYLKPWSIKKKHLHRKSRWETHSTASIKVSSSLKLTKKFNN